MKNGQRFTILTSLVAAVFILSMFSGIAVAQKPADLNENKAKFESTGKQFIGHRLRILNCSTNVVY
jgi:hypothetical protein